MKGFDAKAALGGMSLEEKASLLSGKDFWSTKPLPRAGIEALTLTDGPHGLRKQATDGSTVSLHQSVSATCFPSGAGLASTWNKALIREVGKAIGEEALAEDVAVVLGPAINMKRSPLCGRNFEYMSEDPLLAGEMAGEHIAGLQSSGVGASVKHFAANSQERDRMTSDSIVGERALREIYLPAFEIAIKGAKPWTVMCAYNKINGEYCSQNRWLLTELLREEWGYEGVLLTDWGACADRVKGLAAGQDLQMPGSGGLEDADVVKAVREGRLSMEVLDKAALRILELYGKATERRGSSKGYDKEAHHALARRVAAESMVLLKNEGGALPLAREGRIAFVGGFAARPRYQGGGSSHITPTRMDSALEEARKLVAGKAEILFAEGYPAKGDAVDEALVAEAKKVAEGADRVVLFIGLTDAYESEGFDRKHLRLPPAHEALVAALSAGRKDLVVVLSNGAPVEMPWEGEVAAILEGYLAGQGGGGAVADLLFGAESPSGKLAETFPARLQDNPSYLNFARAEKKVSYGEGVFIGYRHYEALDLKPLFPFGHGLSYARFQYGSLKVAGDASVPGCTLRASFRVRNVGAVRAREVAQLYVGELDPVLPRPRKELKGFEKVALDPGEEKQVEIELGPRAFAFWDEDSRGWKVQGGEYAVSVGSSSADIRLEERVTLAPSGGRAMRYDQDSSLSELAMNPRAGDFARRFIAAVAARFGDYEEGSGERIMMMEQAKEMPLRNICRMGGAISRDELGRIIAFANGEGDGAVLGEIAKRLG